MKLKSENSGVHSCKILKTITKTFTLIIIRLNFENQIAVQRVHICINYKLLQAANFKLDTHTGQDWIFFAALEHVRLRPIAKPKKEAKLLP